MCVYVFALCYPMRMPKCDHVINTVDEWQNDYRSAANHYMEKQKKKRKRHTRARARAK